jgi:hypothetical protein
VNLSEIQGKLGVNLGEFLIFFGKFWINLDEIRGNFWVS